MQSIKSEMRTSRQIGFTLVELMVTIIIVAILAVIALPSIGSTLATSDLNTAQEDFVQILKKAQGLSMTQGTITTVTVTSATRSATLAVLDGSAAAFTVTASNRIAINEDSVYTFNPFGVVAITSLSGSIVLSAPNYSAINSRVITVTTTGVVNVSR